MEYLFVEQGNKTRVLILKQSCLKENDAKTKHKDHSAILV